MSAGGEMIQREQTGNRCLARGSPRRMGSALEKNVPAKGTPSAGECQHILGSAGRPLGLATRMDAHMHGAPRGKEEAVSAPIHMKARV